MDMNDIATRTVMISIGTVGGLYVGTSLAVVSEGVLSADATIIGATVLGAGYMVAVTSDTFTTKALDFMNQVKSKTRDVLFDMKHPGFSKEYALNSAEYLNEKDRLYHDVSKAEKRLASYNQRDEFDKPVRFKGKSYHSYLQFDDLVKAFYSRSVTKSKLNFTLSKSANNVVFDNHSHTLLFSSDGKSYKVENVALLHTTKFGYMKDTMEFSADMKDFSFTGQRNTAFASVYAFKMSNGFNDVSKECKTAYETYQKVSSKVNDKVMKNKQVFRKRPPEETLEVVYDQKSRDYNRPRSM